LAATFLTKEDTCVTFVDTFVTLADTFLTQDGTCVTQEETFPTQDGTCVTLAATFLTQEDTFPPQEATFPTQEDTFLTQDGTNATFSPANVTPAATAPRHAGFSRTWFSAQPKPRAITSTRRRAGPRLKPVFIAPTGGTPAQGVNGALSRRFPLAETLSRHRPKRLNGVQERRFTMLNGPGEPQA
jgi:hypothetical protein